MHSNCTFKSYCVVPKNQNKRDHLQVLPVNDELDACREDRVTDDDVRYIASVPFNNCCVLLKTTCERSLAVWMRAYAEDDACKVCSPLKSKSRLATTTTTTASATTMIESSRARSASRAIYACEAGYTDRQTDTKAHHKHTHTQTHRTDAPTCTPAHTHVRNIRSTRARASARYCFYGTWSTSAYLKPTETVLICGPILQHQSVRRTSIVRERVRALRAHRRRRRR